MRGLLRVAFGAALLVAVAAGVFAMSAILTPPTLPAEVVVGRAADVSDVPVRVRLAQFDRLAALARLRRSASPIGGSGTGDPHGLYLIRDEGGAIRAYLVADPRNGCALEWIQVEVASGPVRPVYEPRFHDTCHGSLYDRDGTVVGGPSPWTLDEAIISVRDGILYARTDDVRPGMWLAGERSTIVPGCDLRANVRSVAPDGRMSILGLAAGAQEFIGQVYRGPFVLRVHPAVRVEGREANDLDRVVSVGDTVCLKFKKQESIDEPIAFPGSSWVLTEVSVLK